MAKKAFLATLVYLLSVDAWPKPIQVVDQHGQAVANALVVVEIAAKLFMPKIPAIITHTRQEFYPVIQVIDKGQALRVNLEDTQTHEQQITHNSSEVRHSVSPTDSAPLLRLNHSGLHTVECLQHAQTKGYIYVTAQESAAITDLNGMVDIRFAGQQIKLWHAKLEQELNEPQLVSLTTDKLGNYQAQIQLNTLP
ncbi:hypothetical protein [Paraglaciecola aestuariivivens]